MDGIDLTELLQRRLHDVPSGHDGLAAAIMTPLVFPQAGLSVGPSWDDVKRLLAAAEGMQPVDIRDYALLMLLAVYGFRAGEVTALCL